MSGFSFIRLCTTSSNTASLAPATAAEPKAPLPDVSAFVDMGAPRPLFFERPRPPVIAITGGPCGGKTSLLDLMRTNGLSGGRAVFTIPEAISIVPKAGASLGKVTAEAERCALECELAGIQSGLEDFTRRLAANQTEPTAVLCDRGLKDLAVWCDSEQWHEILSTLKTSEGALARRYDLVLHMTSIAVDKPELYHNRNNPARWENPEQAAAQDQALMDAWWGHPNRCVIDNSTTSFDAKLATARQCIDDFVHRWYDTCDAHTAAYSGHGIAA